MLVEQFRITDLYHPCTMPSFLMLVHSPIEGFGAYVPASSYQSDRIRPNLSPVHDKLPYCCPDIYNNAPIVNSTYENAEGGTWTCPDIELGLDVLGTGVLAGLPRSTSALGNARTRVVRTRVWSLSHSLAFPLDLEAA